MPRVKCTNGECKFNNHDGKCTKSTIELGYNGCESFEKNIIYYIHLVWDKLDSLNMILPLDMTHDLMIGIYYVTELYGLEFHGVIWGNDSFFVFSKNGVKNGSPLSYNDIISIDMNMEKFRYHLEKFNQGILPPYDEDKSSSKETETIEPKVDSQPFGWLSPTGDFTESDWGTHEEAAQEIVKKKGFEDEYEEWISASDFRLYRDFLIYEKGYVLIHNPSLFGGYKVTYVKDLTKDQKDFLYGYFYDMGDKWNAEKYFND